MEKVRYEHLRGLLALQIIPELRELQRRQALLQATLWVGLTLILSGLILLIAMVATLNAA